MLNANHDSLKEFGVARQYLNALVNIKNLDSKFTVAQLNYISEA
ncbi:MAG: hypothetical protein AAF757_13830 [Cyanobacteria bacterium P01_D01_bin.116]